jgi:hypothetical protein
MTGTIFRTVTSRWAAWNLVRVTSTTTAFPPDLALILHGRATA